MTMSPPPSSADGAHFPHGARRPGKVIAVHLSYRSRASQRGREPAAPSYFLKPASSLGRSGDQVVRPADCELLAFEGEIGLVIGRPARWLSEPDAWGHVGWVTAANDFGVYDFRSADKGSNLRSKGRDGYSPLGPTYLEAAQVDPAGLRLRTWLNGTLVQDDTTADLLFSLPQIVADLSQHVTLEPGDVILTGTPAGSSVTVPGDVVEVEVCQPANGATSGRLRSPIVADDEHHFDVALGSLPKTDDSQRIAAWGSAALAGISTPRAEVKDSLAPELRAKLEAASVASLSSQLRRRGLNNVHIDGVHPLPGTDKLVGVAATLRFVANREDLFTEYGAGYNAQKRAFDAVSSGEVLVIEARGDSRAGTLGDVLALRAKVRGAAGIVTDGAVRDALAVADTGIAVFASGSHPAVLGRQHIPWEAGVTISCGGTAVQPGDVLVGDADGVVVIPPGLAEEVADAALAQEVSDTWIADRVAEGERLEGLFPLTGPWKDRFEAERASDEC